MRARQLRLRISLSTLVLSLLLAVLGSCSKDNTGPSPDSLAAEATRQIDPVAELTARVAIQKFSPQDAKDEALLNELHTKYAPNVHALKDSLCATVRKTAKQSSSKLGDVRAPVDQSLRDSFVGKFLQAAVTAPAEEQRQIVDSLDIKSKGSNGSSLEGSSALRDASFSNPQGMIQIPTPGSAQYADYTDWLMRNSAFTGFIHRLTTEYTEAIQNCPLG